MDPIQTFQSHLEGRGAAVHTISGYVQDLRAFSTWFERQNREQLDPQNLTPIDIRLYRQELLKGGSAPSTINRRLAALRAYGAMLKSSGQVDNNPAQDIRLVERLQVSPKWLDKREQNALIRQLERLVNAARSKAGKRQAIRDQAAALLMLNTGLRVAELCALDLEDIDLHDRGGAVRVRIGKGDKPRKIPLNQQARRALRLWLEWRGDPDRSGGQLWSGKRGEGMTPSAFERRIREVGRLAEIELTPHTLRHTFAKNLIDAGAGIEVVSKLLGHSRLETTRLYTIPGEKDLAHAVAKLDF